MPLLHPLTIGDLVLPHNLLLAPLAGITNHVFRLICRQRGASLAFTEMVSVNGMVREGNKTLALLSSSAEDRPLGVQLFGDNAELLAQAAGIIEDKFDLIDINMGCPVRKVVGTGAGSALLKDTAQITQIVRSVRKATQLPLTIKIRSGWQCGDDTWMEVGRIAEAEGCNAITLHPRSRAQMFNGQADWSQITRLKQLVKIPVIGSGDLFTPQDCQRMLQETGCDGLMVARGSLGNPWIFSQTRELLTEQTVTSVTAADRVATALKHLELFTTEAGEAVALREMKKHLGWYIHGVSQAAALRRQVNTSQSLDELKHVIRLLS